jgi:uncharacterized membrane protein YoaK (UPF0700 family)
MRHLRDAWRVLVPAAGDPHGPLPPLLVLLTLVTGLVDAFSYLELGHVLVANMTGNVVFLGFAVAGAPGFRWWASLLAIGTFLLGALAGGRIAVAVGRHRGRHLLWATLVEGVLVAVALVVALAARAPYSTTAIVVFVAVLGVALGIQNATARALAVPDLTTTVLTLTITGIASDSRAGGGADSRLGRRLVPIAVMLLGGLIGAALTVRGHGTSDLAVATAALAVVVVGAGATARSTGAWVTKP